MKILNESYFKNKEKDYLWFENWVNELETKNSKKYERIRIQTSLGNTQIWGVNTQKLNLETLIIFPGARTTALFWDLDNGLNNLKHEFRIFLVETNGLPNLSEGKSPDIKSNDYGYWAQEVLQKLNISKAYIAGASFGGLICSKLAIVKPEMIKAMFLLNSGNLQPFSLSFSNLYYNLLPIFFPNSKNVQKFLDNAILSKPNHQLAKVFL